MSCRRAARRTTAAYAADGEEPSFFVISRGVRIIDGRLCALVGGHAAPQGDSEAKLNKYSELLRLRDFVPVPGSTDSHARGVMLDLDDIGASHSFELLHPRGTEL